jgi:diguanylate cyclase (GGDEF)-like protein
MQSRVTDILNPITGFRPEDGRTESELQAENERLNLLLNQMRLRVLELERTADTDPLVPVYNRRAFIREVEKARTVMERYDILSSVIFFDLNNFKSINDRFGHGIGDELLRKTGSSLLENVRSCDLVARLGGDEFGVLLFKSTIAETKAKAASLACHIAQQHIIMPTGNIHISAAWGAAPCTADDTAEQIIARADRAMFTAKRENT